MGIYPCAVVRGGVEELRTEWQDGWNAAVMAMTKKHGELTKWVRTLSPEQRALIGEMLDSDSEPVHLRVKDGEVGLRASCSDTFMYACSDSEDFTLEELPEIHRLWKQHGYVGVIAWIARKRNVEPVKEYRYDASFLAAKADV